MSPAGPGPGSLADLTGHELADRHREQRSAIDLAFIGRVIQRESEQRRKKRRQPHRLRNAVVQDEELQQDGRAAHQLHVADEGQSQRPRPVDAPDRDQHSAEPG